MFKFLSKNKNGFTLIELVVVLLLLSFGVLALANMFKVTYRAFNKAEERYIKQEAVKEVANTLRTGKNNVAAALTADVFPEADDPSLTVVPTGDLKDKSYSYLYIMPQEDDEGNILGYFLYVQNRGVTQNAVKEAPLSDIPMYATINVIQDDVGDNYYGVVITLAALEDDYSYEKDDTGKILPPEPDDIYYSLDVAYHFPNMATNKDALPVNYSTKTERTTAPLYKLSGEKADNNAEIETVDANGAVLRVYVDSIIAGDNTETNAQVPSFCFIATASYGLDSGEVGLLCRFRDEHLLTNPLGTAFVNAYYKLSPPIAEFISDSEPLKAAVRVALKPLVAVATNVVEEDAAAENAPWFVMFMLCGVGMTATLIRVKKRNKRVEE